MAFKSLLDPTFTYRNAASTDVGETFVRVRRELMEQRRRGVHESDELIAVNSTAAATGSRHVYSATPKAIP